MTAPNGDPPARMCRNICHLERDRPSCAPPWQADAYGGMAVAPYAGWKMQSSSLQEKERSLGSLLEIRTYVAR